MRELILMLNPSFTDEDKEKCVHIIGWIIQLANIARRKGLLSLESVVKDEDGVFLKMSIMMIVDGCDPEEIKRFMYNLILAEAPIGYELLSRLIMAEGCLSIQDGENPRIIADKLTAMLGDDNGDYQKRVESYNDTRFTARVAEDTEKDAWKRWMMEDDSGDPERKISALEIIMRHLSDEAIMRLLKEVENVELGIALKGRNPALKRPMRLIPKWLRDMVFEDVYFMGPVRVIDIEAAEDTMINIISRLVSSGEIVLS